MVSAKTCKLLLKYLHKRKPYEDDDPPFVSLTTGNRLATSGLGMIIKRLGRDSGLKTSMHHTRRSGALLMYNKG